MLRLYVMRHAKSSWAVPGAKDFDRELNDRGIDDLARLSKTFKQEGIEPDKIICSSATRTKQTLSHIQDSFSNEPEIVFTERLYSSGLHEYIDIINSVSNAKSLMVIGHNPMCGTLATSLPKAGPAEELEKIAYRYPTAAISIIDFDFDDWSSVAKYSGTLVKSIFPSEI